MRPTGSDALATRQAPNPTTPARACRLQRHVRQLIAMRSRRNCALPALRLAKAAARIARDSNLRGTEGYQDRPANHLQSGSEARLKRTQCPRQAYRTAATEIARARLLARAAVSPAGRHTREAPPRRRRRLPTRSRRRRPQHRREGCETCWMELSNAQAQLQAVHSICGSPARMH
jgi:hypothetical protein